MVSLPPFIHLPSSWSLHVLAPLPSTSWLIDELYAQKLKYKAISEELDHALNDMTPCKCSATLPAHIRALMLIWSVRHHSLLYLQNLHLYTFLLTLFCTILDSHCLFGFFHILLVYSPSRLVYANRPPFRIHLFHIVSARSPTMQWTGDKWLGHYTCRNVNWLK